MDELNKSETVNKRLAELLGWRDIVRTERGIGGVHPDYRHDHLEPVPDWCGDWAACGPLMVQHAIDVMFNWDTVHGRYSQSGHYRAAIVSHGDDWQAATRYAVVMAVTQKLEAAK